MTLWAWVLLAAGACLALKLAGYLVPQSAVADPRVRHIGGAVTVGMLAALVVVQAFSDGAAFVLDARLVALVIAAVALVLRAPFIVVVLLGALAAAGVRALGWG